MDDLQGISKALAVLETEVKNMQGATTERTRIWEQRLADINTRMLSLHDSISLLRGEGVTVGKQLVAIDLHTSEVKDDLDKLEAKTIEEIDTVKKGQAAWIEGIGQRFKWIVSTIIALAALALVVWHP